MKKLLASQIHKNPITYLKQRKLLYYVSNDKLYNDQEFSQMLPRGLSAYIGFDPTAESIHLGNLIGLIALTHFRLAGYKPIILFGGATGLIGDPSGRVTDRQQLRTQEVEHNVRKLQDLFTYITQNSEKALKKVYEDIPENPKQYNFINNIEFYKDTNIISFLRDIGIHFRLGRMLSRESVKSRMHEQGEDGGMSFTEFTYQIFQGYDFYKLNQTYNCKVQIGGSDQWGNIASGIELVRKINEGQEVYGLTVPLLVNSAGKKIGKSDSNAGSLWLDPLKTSPFELYQYLLNVSDDDVENLLLRLTFLPIESIEETIERHQKDQGERRAQKLLAEELTEFVHGREAVEKVLNTTKSLFKTEKEEIMRMNREQFEIHFQYAQKFKLSKNDLVDISSLFVKCGMRNTKAEVKRLMVQGGVQINFETIMEDRKVEEGDILHGKWIIIKIGKKNYSLIEMN